MLAITVFSFRCRNTEEEINNCKVDRSTTVVPNRGAIYSAQRCCGLRRFFTISLKIHFQTVNLKANCYGCRKLLFFSVGCRKRKKVGKHWSTTYGTGQQFCSPARLELTWNCLARPVYAKLEHIFWPRSARGP